MHGPHGKTYGYLAFYAGQQKGIQATSLLEAKKIAIQLFKVPKSKWHLVTVMLAEKDGDPVIHTPDF